MSSLSSRRRGDMNSKLHMDRQPMVTRITDPSLPAGKRREIDNVMKKARANSNDYWDKKLLEVEEKDPNRWRHTGYKKMYIQGESSSGESDREGASYRYNSSQQAGAGGSSNVVPPPSGRYARSRSPNSRSRSNHNRRMSPANSLDGHTRGRPRSPPPLRIGMPRSPTNLTRRSPMHLAHRSRPRSPPLRRKASRSPIMNRRRSRSNSMDNMRRRSPSNQMAATKRDGGGHILPRSKRPPSPPPRRQLRSRSNSSLSSCSSDLSVSVCSDNTVINRSRSTSLNRKRIARSRPRSPSHYFDKAPAMSAELKDAPMHVMRRPYSPPTNEKYRYEKMRRTSRDPSIDGICSDGNVKVMRSAHHSPPEDPRLKNRPPEPPEPAASSSSSLSKKTKKKNKLLRAPRIKIEGEKQKKRKSSSESDDSGESDSGSSSLKTFTAFTRYTLSERFGRIAQWSAAKLNMDNMNMRITKDSGGSFKVMIEDGADSPTSTAATSAVAVATRRYSYSPAPPGHFPEELALTAPVDLMEKQIWDDVAERYNYYKNRGYLRGLTLQEYMKWEEWWYKYQDWLRQDRECEIEYWRTHDMRRRRKKLPITQRLN